MKFYIIDLSLEYGLRSRLAVSSIDWFRPKINEREQGGANWQFVRVPLFFLTYLRGAPNFTTPHFLYLLHFLPRLLHHACATKLPNPKISCNFQLQNSLSQPPSQTSHHQVLKLGRTGKNQPRFQRVGVLNRSLNTYPRYGHTIHLLVASIFYKLGQKSLHSNTQFNLKLITEIQACLGLELVKFGRGLVPLA